VSSASSRKPLPLRILQGLYSVYAIVWMLFLTSLCSTLTLLLRPIHRDLSRWAGRMWGLLLVLGVGIRLRVTGAEKLDRRRTYIFMSNHLSAADIIILYTAIPFPVGYLAKKELFRIPLFGWAMRAAGHIPIDRDNPREAKKAIERAVEVVKSGDLSLIIFPEGTRSTSGELGRFKLGGFSLAVSAGVDIVPMAISGTRDLLPKGAYHLNPRPISVRMGEPIRIGNYDKQSKALLAERTREAILGLSQSRASGLN